MWINRTAILPDHIGRGPSPQAPEDRFHPMNGTSEEATPPEDDRAVHHHRNGPDRDRHGGGRFENNNNSHAAAEGGGAGGGGGTGGRGGGGAGGGGGRDESHGTRENSPERHRSPLRRNKGKNCVKRFCLVNIRDFIEFCLYEV